MKKFRFLLFYFILYHCPTFGQWQSMNGPYGGQIQCIAADQLNNRIAVGTPNEIYLSNDYGLNWSVTTGNLPLVDWGVKKIAIEGNIICVSIDGLIDDLIYLSTNSGQTWTQILSVGSNFIDCIEINDSIIYLGTNGWGIYSTADYGQNWAQLTNGTTSYDVNSLFFSDSIFYAAIGNELYYSNDNGINWNSFYSVMNPLKSVAKSGSQIFTCTYDSVYFSNDNGLTWSPANNGLVPIFIQSISTNGSAIILISSDGVYYSTLPNISWNPIITNFPLLNTASSITSNDSIFYIGNTTYGILKSVDNGNSWQAANSGINNEDIHALEVINNEIYAGTSGNGLFKCTIGTYNWQEFNIGLSDGNVNTIHYADSLVFCGTHAGIFKSSNFGNSWQLASNGIPITFPISSISENNSELFAGQYLAGGIYKSIDYGNSWINLNFGLTDSTIYDFDFSNSEIFICTNDGIFKSNLSPISWSAANNGINGFTFSIDINSSGIFAGGGSSAELYKSTNGGVFWTQLTNGLGNTNIYSIASYANLIFVGATYGDAFMSSDGGLNWIDIHAGLPNKHIHSLYVDTINFIIYAGTGSGVWKRELSDIVKVAQVNKHVFEVFPNPFKDQIYLNTPRDLFGRVNIQIVDLKGETVSESQIELTQYQNQLSINTSNLISGVYYLKLLSKDFTNNVKIVKM